MIPPILPAFVLALALVAPSDHDIPERAPHAVVSTPVHSGLRGVASWLVAPSGTGAAGPALRRALGADWRGMRVRVTGPAGSTVVRLTDFCGCPGGRIIDLARSSVLALGLNPARGLYRVTVVR